MAEQELRELKEAAEGRGLAMSEFLRKGMRRDIKAYYRWKENQDLRQKRRDRTT